MRIEVVGIPRAIWGIQPVEILGHLRLGHGGHDMFFFFFNPIVEKNLNFFCRPFVGVLIGTPVAPVRGTMPVAHGAVPDMGGFQSGGIRFESSPLVIDPTKRAILRPPFVGAVRIMAIPIFCAHRLETSLLDIHEPEAVVQRKTLAGGFVAPVILRNQKQIRIHRRKLGVVVVVCEGFENLDLASLGVTDSNPPEIAKIPIEKEVFPISGHREMRHDSRELASTDLLFA